MDNGFVRVGAAVPKVRVADIAFNTDRIIDLIKKASAQKVQILVFPELAITSYTCADLFFQNILIDSAIASLQEIAKATAGLEIVAIVGAPLNFEGRLYNCAAVLQNGKVLGIVPKINLPNSNEFYEKRWFSSGKNIKNVNIKLFGDVVPFGVDILFCDEEGWGVNFGVEICEDLWVPLPPSSYQAVAGAILLFNLSASNEIIGKLDYRKMLISAQSSKCAAAYIYASAGTGESSTDLVFGGHAIISEYGHNLAELERFSSDSQIICADVDTQRLNFERKKNEGFYQDSESGNFRKVQYKLSNHDSSNLLRHIDAYPFVPKNDNLRDERCKEIFAIQTEALATRYRATGSKNAIIGISGGLDSTLAFLVTVFAFDKLNIPRKNVIAITMPGFGTTTKTYNNALALINSLGARLIEIDIKKATLGHFEDIGHAPDNFDITYENSQARERTQILMDIANQEGGLVIGTGDLSELALGWCTYNADHMSMYGVNCSVPKTLVKYMVGWVADYAVERDCAEVLRRVLDTPISPELIPPDAKGEIIQRTEEIIGPYDLHDFFIYNTLRFGYSPSKIIYLAGIAFKDKFSKDKIEECFKIFIKRFITQQFKRSCMPDGPKVGSISLSPRGDLRMPSDAAWCLWLSK